MEPFRATVDRVAIGVWQDYGPDAVMDKSIKTRLLEVAKERFESWRERIAKYLMWCLVSPHRSRPFTKGERTRHSCRSLIDP